MGQFSNFFTPPLPYTYQGDYVYNLYTHISRKGEKVSGLFFFFLHITVLLLQTLLNLEKMFHTPGPGAESQC